MSDHPWVYEPEAAAALISSISADRFGTFLAAAGTNEAALRLYTWNAGVSSSFYPLLQTLEVVLRNSIHGAVTMSTGNDRWFDDDAVMRPSELADVDRARTFLAEKGKGATVGRVVAELPLGFWVSLCSNKYDQTLWRSAVAGLFPKHLRQRGPIHDDLDRLRTLRNRIAHHEPVFQRNLAQDLVRIRKVVGCLNIEVLRWMDHHSTAAGVIAASPADISHF